VGQTSGASDLGSNIRNMGEYGCVQLGRAQDGNPGDTVAHERIQVITDMEV